MDEHGRLSGDVFSAIREDRRAAALAAIASVVDPASIVAITPTTLGASGASTLRVDTTSDRYLLRLEPGRRGFQDPRRSFPCLRAAAAAGIAPSVHYADAEAGVVLMDFVIERPLTEFPGGGPALVSALGEMVSRLQSTAPFPPVARDFGALVEVLLRFICDGGLFAPGVLDGHLAEACVDECLMNSGEACRFHPQIDHDVDIIGGSCVK